MILDDFPRRRRPSSSLMSRCRRSGPFPWVLPIAARRAGAANTWLTLVTGGGPTGPRARRQEKT